MSGLTEFAIYPIVAASLIASITDLWRGKIYNWLTLPLLVTGIAFGAWHGGWHGLGQSVFGAGAGLALYGWMFWIGVMGGGDVKLLMALGAWGGPGYSMRVAVLGVLLGGVMALLMLLAKGKLGDLARRLSRFLVSILVKELEVEFPEVDRRLTMPFGLSIAGAGVWVALADPLARWGILPW